MAVSLAGIKTKDTWLARVKHSVLFCPVYDLSSLVINTLHYFHAEITDYSM